MSIFSSIEGHAVKAWIEGQGKKAELGSLKAALIEMLIAQNPDYAKLLREDPEEWGRVVGGVVTAFMAARAQKKGLVLLTEAQPETQK